MRAKILDSENKNLEAIEKEIYKAVIELNIVGEVEKVKDMDIIRKFDVDRTPALVINNKVKVFGRLPEKEEIKKWIKEEK